MIKLKFEPNRCEFIQDKDSNISAIAVTDSKTGDIHLIEEESMPKLVEVDNLDGEDILHDDNLNRIIKIHNATPVAHIKVRRKCTEKINCDKIRKVLGFNLIRHIVLGKYPFLFSCIMNQLTQPLILCNSIMTSIK